MSAMLSPASPFVSHAMHQMAAMDHPRCLAEDVGGAGSVDDDDDVLGRMCSAGSASPDDSEGLKGKWGFTPGRDDTLDVSHGAFHTTQSQHGRGEPWV